MQDGGARITFFDRTYEEAFRLLVEARDYLADRQGRDAEAVPPATRLVMSCETMRLTTRLVQVMAWLLVQKAVQAGEIEPEDADRPDRRLGGQEICAGQGPWETAALPRQLRLLLERSQALYDRVARLDEMVHIRISQGREKTAPGDALEDPGKVPL